MASKIQFMRGLKSKLTKTLSLAEPYVATDTGELIIGTRFGNVNIGGSHWYTGTAMSGTSATTGAYSYSACPVVKVGDIYLNTSNGNVYECTTAGSGTTAKWTYNGNIKGAAGVKGDKGDTGAKGDKGDTGATGAKGANASTVVVAASDSKNKASADYVCTGSGDQSVINTAINELPSTGGKVVLLEGTYNMASEIRLYRGNVSLEGMGPSTILKNTGSSHTIVASRYAEQGQHHGLTIRNLVIDAENQTGNHAIAVYYHDYCEISGVEIRNFPNNGIELYGTSKVHIHDCDFYNGKIAIFGWGNVHDSTISDITVDTVEKAVYLTGSCTLNVLYGCFMRSCSTAAIQVEAHYNIISNCGMYVCGKGIIATGQRCVVQGNYVRSSSEAGIYVNAAYCNVNGNITAESSDKSIHLGSSATNCLVTDNVLDKAYTNDGGATNVFANNKS